jgi:hypothetical protein
MIICFSKEKKSTCGAEFSNVIFSAMKSSPSIINVPQPNVPAPITLDDCMRGIVTCESSERYKNYSEFSKYGSH